MEGSAKGFLCELVLRGDSIDNWDELVAQQIIFTKQSLRRRHKNLRVPHGSMRARNMSTVSVLLFRHFERHSNSYYTSELSDLL